MSDNLPDDKCHIPFYSTVGKKICNLWPFFVMEKKSNFVQDRIFFHLLVGILRFFICK